MRGFADTVGNIGAPTAAIERSRLNTPGDWPRQLCRRSRPCIDKLEIAFVGKVAFRIFPSERAAVILARAVVFEIRLSCGPVPRAITCRRLMHSDWSHLSDLPF